MASFFLGTLIIAIVVLVEIQGKSLEPGPQVFNDSVKLPPLSSQKRYATKEIILYLTPSQIKALYAGQGFINPQNNPHLGNEKPTHAYPQVLPGNHGNNENQQHLQQSQPLKVPPVEEPQSDHFVPIIPPPQYRHSDGNAYINFQPQYQPRIPKPVQFIPEPHEQIGPHENKLPTLIPHEPILEKNQDNVLRDYLKEQWYRLLDQNRAHLKTLVALSQYQTEKSSEAYKNLFPYAPKYNDQKYVSDVENLFNNNQQSRQQALLQAEAIANSPPLLIHKEISIKHNPVQHIKVPVPTPVLIPIPEPFEVKVPQPYPVPLEIIKQVPVPIVKTQKIEIERQVPIEIEKHIPYPVIKNVDRPYLGDRHVPHEVLLHKIEPVPNQNRLWQN